MELSIITATYNRHDTLPESIRSGLACAATKSCKCEIIVVDDGSTDNSIQNIKKIFSAELSSGLLRIELLGKNCGVNVARNHGIRLARFDWVVFMDSDDTFAVENFSDCIDEIQSRPDYQAFFFRCRDSQTGELVGNYIEKPYLVDARRMLQEGTPGECLIVGKRKLFLENPFDEDLRGFEGLTYIRILRKINSIPISTKIIRNYTQGDSRVRLSNKKGIRKRAGHLAIGYSRMIREFYSDLGFKKKLRIILSIFYYAFLSKMKY